MLHFKGLKIGLINAHLASRSDDISSMNRNITSIFKEARVGLKDLCITMQCHHVIFMGDLNYRVDANLLRYSDPSNEILTSY